MSSHFAWLDHSENDRRRALEVIDLFREQGTRDELGIGTVRDALSDALFPGISTIQTRARYFLFVPWIYLELEARKTRSRDIDRRARRFEIELILELLKSGDTEGVIGKEARSALQRLPSSVYWVGLGVFGIRRFQGSQEQYHRSLDHFYRRQRSFRTASGENAAEAGNLTNWHEGLPKPLENFPEGATLQLDAQEADYLRQQIMSHEPRTLLAFLVDRNAPWEPVDFPWLHPSLDDCDVRIVEQVRHARHFSKLMLGAALLYNLMLAEKRAALPASEEMRAPPLIDHYRQRLNDWHADIESHRDDLVAWTRDRESFWKTVRRINPRIPVPTRHFIDSWCDLVISHRSAGSLTGDRRMRTLVHHRERRLKRGLARLDNPRALELWNGASGTDRLSFRWPQAQNIVLDILSGLKGGER